MEDPICAALLSLVAGLVATLIVVFTILWRCVARMGRAEEEVRSLQEDWEHGEW